jgi:hypothetical protein
VSPSPKSEDAIYCRFEHGARRFEVMMEVEGRFAGMVHVYDLGMSMGQNRDILISGAQFRSGILVVTPDDVFVEVDGLVEAAERALIRRTMN